MLSRIRTRCAIFREETRGSLTVEAVILLPVLLWCFVAMFVFFDAFRARSISEKATYTIGDMISRETGDVTPTYIDNTKKLLDFLAETDSAHSALRITVAKWSKDDTAYKKVWSQTRGGKQALTDAQIAGMADRLPKMIDGEQVIIVETWVDYQSLMNLEFLNQQIETYSFTKPRFAPQVVWKGA